MPIAGFLACEHLSFEEEGRLGMGVSNDEKKVQFSVLEPKVITSLTRYYGLYLRPQYSQERFQIYGLFGLAGVNLEVEVEDLDGLIFDDYKSGEDSGLSYGLGVGFSPEGSLFFNIEYLNMIDSDDYTFNGINLRVEFKL